jgi:hypothetical protein
MFGLFERAVLDVMEKSAFKAIMKRFCNAFD